MQLAHQVLAGGPLATAKAIELAEALSAAASPSTAPLLLLPKADVDR
jgi:hypothetical protein